MLLTTLRVDEDDGEAVQGNVYDGVDVAVEVEMEVEGHEEEGAGLSEG